MFAVDTTILLLFALNQIMIRLIYTITFSNAYTSASLDFYPSHEAASGIIADPVWRNGRAYDSGPKSPGLETRLG